LSAAHCLTLMLLVGLTQNSLLAQMDTAAATVTASVQFSEAAGKDQSNTTAHRSPVVVWLTAIDNPQPRPSEQKAFTMTQQGTMFHPHLLVIPVGGTVVFPNKDPFFHNVFSLFNGRRFDLGLYQSGQSRSVVFNRTGVSYIFCDIHPQMGAVILALDTPYYGSADEHGKISIPAVPAGIYTLHVWSEAASADESQLLTRRVTVAQNSTTDLGTITIHVSTKMLSDHLNKFGENYDTHKPPAY